MVETWLPVMHETYYERYGDRVDLISTWFDEARTGLVVPAYVEIDSIGELNENAAKFQGRVTGIDAGAGIMEATDMAIEQYGLDFELMASSGPAMTAALQSAIEDGQWIVVTGWTPHWKFARFDLKFLEDPKGVYGAIEQVHAAARKGFAEDFPEVAALLAHMKFSPEELGTLMGVMEERAMDEQAATREWMRENSELIESWLR